MTEIVELTPPERAAAMVGPGQEGALGEFLQELEQRDAAEAKPAEETPEAEEQPELLAGKFKSAADLEKAYKELERKLGQRATDKDSLPVDPTPEPLSREQAVSFYGESIVAAADEAGIDLGAWDQTVRAGGDTKELREKLAAQTGIPAQLIEQYEAAFRPQPAQQQAATESEGLSDADVAELKTLVGGEQEFDRLSQWAKANLSQDELADYNAAVDSGNKAAVRLALRAMQARASVKPQGEPELIGGGTPPRADVFKTQEEALTAMRKTDERGRNLYREDPDYRKWYEKTLARSTFPA